MTPKIEITEEQKKLIPVYRDKWLAIGRATGPVDRDAFEQAVTAMYIGIGKKAPEVVWYRSPFEALTEGIRLYGNEMERGAIAKKGWGEALDAARKHVINDIQVETIKLVKKETLTHVGNLMAPLVLPVIMKLEQDLSKSCRMAVASIIFAQHDASWFSFYDYCAEVFGHEACKKLSNLFATGGSGWYWTLEDTVIATERPSKLVLDDGGRPHCETGTAIEYSDGFSLYCWHGVQVPGIWLENRQALDPSLVLTWQNIEQRRCLAEIIGWARVLDRLQPRVIDQDPDPMIGTLLEVDLPDAPKERFLRVRCGTGRDFCIPVSNTVNTALEANAESFEETDLNSFRNYIART